jgi:spore germination cell wall hydrolase CwlJ-like protein
MNAAELSLPRSWPQLPIVKGDRTAEWLNLRTAVVMVALVLALLSLSASAATETKARLHASPFQATATNPAEVLPTSLRPISRDAALELNRRIPFTSEPNVAAQPFAFTGDDQARARALACLTAAVYYEAGNESDAGKRAVAQVVLNRVRNPAFPSNVCGVVFQGSTLPAGCQFTFTCDGSLLRIPERSSWAASEKIANDALSGTVLAAVGLSTHYHADYVVPYWATRLAKTAQVGTHIFYRWPGALADLRPVERRYDGHESDPAALRAAALMTDGVWPQDADADGNSSMQIRADPQLQLIGVVRLLASAQQDSSSAYENDVRAYFAAANDSPAVQFFRGTQADGSTAQAEGGLATALAAFGKQTDWQQFFRSHRSFYEKSIAGSERKLEAAVEAWQAYTAMPLKSEPIAAAVGPAGDDSICLVAAVVPRRALWVGEDDSARTPADLFLASGLSPRSFLTGREGSGARQKATAIDPALEEQVVRAVFARIEALASGNAEANDAAARDANEGFALVPQLAQRLAYYERHRGEYPDLASFLPRLLDGLQSPSDGASRANAPSLAACPRGARNQVAELDRSAAKVDERLRETP